MISPSKNKGVVITIIVTILTVGGVLGAAAITSHYRNKQSQLEYQRISEDNNLVAKAILIENPSKEKQYHSFEFITIVKDIQVSDGNTVNPNNTLGTPIPTQYLNYYLDKLQSNNISGFFKHYFTNNNGEKEEEIIRCHEANLKKENVTYIAQEVDHNTFKCEMCTS